jgi:hypothetical protein
MKSARNLTTELIEDKSINLQHEKATLINLVLTIKALFSRRSMDLVKGTAINLSGTTVNFIKSGIFLRAFAMIVSIIWMLIIISTVFLG